MNASKLVTYMKLSDQASSGPTDIKVTSADVGIRKFNLGRKDTPFRRLETLVYNQNTAYEGERIIGRETWSTLTLILTERHERTVSDYENQGYQVVIHQDYAEWNRRLDGIPGLDSFGLTFEEKQEEFEVYLKNR